MRRSPQSNLDSIHDAQPLHTCPLLHATSDVNPDTPLLTTRDPLTNSGGEIRYPEEGSGCLGCRDFDALPLFVGFSGSGAGLVGWFVVHSHLLFLFFV